MLNLKSFRRITIMLAHKSSYQFKPFDIISPTYAQTLGQFASCLFNISVGAHLGF